MATCSQQPLESATPVAGPRRDTLAASVVFLIALSCIQPVVTLARGLLFCRWLEPVQLGCWDMAFSFMSLAAPLVVLGIPGLFGRYVESYAARGQLAMFLRRTTIATLVLLVLATAAVSQGGQLLSWFIFSSPNYTHLIGLVAFGLATTIIFGFITELLTALRMFRIASLLQLIKGIGFAVFGGVLLLGVSLGPASVIVAHALACLLAAVVGGWWIWAAWRELPPSAGPTQPDYVPQRQLWQRLMPFALWMWVTNILTNVFEVIDRLMIVHCSSMTTEEALNAVGQYHSSRIVPLLFVSFAGMLASLVLPHLSRDWEAGRRRDVDARVNLTFKVLSLGMMAGSVVLLWVAPWLFHWAFQGRYDGGLEVLPWTLCYCVWFGQSFVAVNYLLCAERVRLSTGALTAGLIANVLCNLALLPLLGLLGAVLATSIGKLLVLALILHFSRMMGMKVHSGTWLLAILPLALAAGAVVATVALMAILAATLRGDRVFRAREKQLFFETMSQLRRRLQPRGGAAANAG